MNTRLAKFPCCALILAVGLSLCSASARAGNVNVIGTWDLNDLSGSIDGGSVAISKGDHVSYSIDFANHQTVNFGYGNNYLLTALASEEANYGYFAIENITLDLLDSNGVAITNGSFSKLSDGSGVAHIGPSWDINLSAGEHLSFGGFKVAFNVTSVTSIMDGSEISPMFNAPFLNITAVPEPSELAMFGIGLLGLGLSRRRRSSNSNSKA